jgi:citrate synthase
MATDTLSTLDDRTGRKYELPIVDGSIRAIDLRQIRVDETTSAL